MFSNRSDIEPAWFAELLDAIDRHPTEQSQAARRELWRRVQDRIAVEALFLAQEQGQHAPGRAAQLRAAQRYTWVQLLAYECKIEGSPRHRWAAMIRARWRRMAPANMPLPSLRSIQDHLEKAFPQGD